MPDVESTRTEGPSDQVLQGEHARRSTASIRAEWQQLNALGDRATRELGRFFADNALLLCLTIAAGVFAYGYELTHLTFSIDEEVLWQTPDARTVWLAQRRWGMYLLQTFLFPEAIYPFTSAALAIVFLSLAAVLFVNRDGQQRVGKAIFCTLFVSFPTFAHIQLFEYMAAFIAFAVLLLVVGERLVASAATGSNLPLIPALLMVTLATASHQSLLFVYITLTLLALTDEAFRNTLSQRVVLRHVGLASVVAVGSVAALFGVNFLLGLKSDGYVEGYFRWGTTPPREILTALWTSASPFLMGVPLTYALVPTLIVPVIALSVLAFKTRTPVLTCCLALLFSVSPLVVHVAIGTWMSSRSMMAVPFAFAGLWYLLFLRSASIVRCAIAIFACYCVVLNSSLISKASMAQEFVYKADSLVGDRILQLIYDVRPRIAEDKTPLAFVGMLDLPRSKLFVKDEAFGGSFWQWDRGNPYRMFLFLQSLGLPITVALAPPTDWPRARALAKDIPAWPDKRCVQLRDGLVIVKLSDEVY